MAEFLSVPTHLNSGYTMSESIYQNDQIFKCPTFWKNPRISLTVIPSEVKIACSILSLQML